jgi:hypothetical protein
MTDPLAFPSQTPRLGLPLLFSGQVQKEAHVNEGLSRLDSLVHCAVESVAAAPPTNPAEGAGWLVGENPQGDWAGKTGQLAFLQSGQWLFFVPHDGMRVHNRATAADLRRIGGQWISLSVPTLPNGGTTVDQEARAALSSLISTLRIAGILGSTGP